MVDESRCPRCEQLIALEVLGDVAICPYCGFELADRTSAAVPPPPIVISSDPDFSEMAPEAAGDSRRWRREGNVTVPRFVIYTQGVLLAVVAIVSFVLGAGFGGLYNTGSMPDSSGQVRCEIHGRVSRSRADGQEEGIEARLIFLPVHKRPDERWPHDGLRPGQEVPPTDHPALVGIRLLGGGFTASNGRGEYRLSVPSSGEYFVLVLAEAPRRRDVSWNKRDLAQVGRYFQDAMKLLGPCDYRWQRLNVTRDEQWDVVFEPP